MPAAGRPAGSAGPANRRTLLAVASLCVSHRTARRALYLSCITFCVTSDGSADARPLLHHFVCHTRRLGGCSTSAASLFMSHQTARRVLPLCCITFCVIPDGSADARPLLHHFLCHTGRLGERSTSLASLFVSHQTARRALHLCCITLCVTPDDSTGARPLLHHFVCHTRRLGGRSTSLASLFVSHQTARRAFYLSCITFCVTPDGSTDARPLLHHFLCHTRRLGGLSTSAASLCVSHQTIRRALDHCCITLCVTPDGSADALPLLHHFVCHTRRFDGRSTSVASLLMLTPPRQRMMQLKKRLSRTPRALLNRL